MGEYPWTSTIVNVGEVFRWVSETFPHSRVVEGSVRTRPWGVTLKLDPGNVDNSESGSRTGGWGVWVKGVPQWLVGETFTLSSLYNVPGIPNIVSSTQDGCFFATEHAGEDVLTASRDKKITAWNSAIGNFVNIQKRSTHLNLAPLTQLNASTWFDVLNDAKMFNFVEANETFRTHKAKLDMKHISEKVNLLLTKLETLNLPHTIVHPDLYSGNITTEGAVIDWAESYLSYPLACLYSASKITDESGFDFYPKVQKLYLQKVAEWVDVPIMLLEKFTPHTFLCASMRKMLTWKKVTEETPSSAVKRESMVARTMWHWNNFEHTTLQLSV